MWGKLVSSDKIVGGTIQHVWMSSLEILGSDGLQYEVRIVQGYGGEELEVRETQSSVARRAAKTRRAKKSS